MTRIDHIDEWHLVFAQAFCHITFGVASRFSQKAVVLEPPFSSARLKPVGPVGDSMDGDGVQ
jgi:hypothetical protein